MKIRNFSRVLVSVRDTKWNRPRQVASISLNMTLCMINESCLLSAASIAATAKSIDNADPRPTPLPPLALTTAAT